MIAERPHRCALILWQGGRSSEEDALLSQQGEETGANEAAASKGKQDKKKDGEKDVESNAVVLDPQMKKALGMIEGYMLLTDVLRALKDSKALPAWFQLMARRFATDARRFHALGETSVGAGLSANGRALELTDGVTADDYIGGMGAEDFDAENCVFSVKFTSDVRRLSKKCAYVGLCAADTDFSCEEEQESVRSKGMPRECIVWGMQEGSVVVRTREEGHTEIATESEATYDGQDTITVCIRDRKAFFHKSSQNTEVASVPLKDMRWRPFLSVLVEQQPRQGQMKKCVSVPCEVLPGDQLPKLRPKEPGGSDLQSVLAGEYRHGVCLLLLAFSIYLRRECE